MTVLSSPRAPLHTLRLPGGEHVTVRLTRPDDAEMLQTYVRALSAIARYNRFFGPLRELPPAELARVTQTNGPSRGTLIAEIGDPNPVIIAELRYAPCPMLPANSRSRWRKTGAAEGSASC